MTARSLYMSSVIYPQQVAADVTCSSGITDYDASVLLQYLRRARSGIPLRRPVGILPSGREWQSRVSVPRDCELDQGS